MPHECMKEFESGKIGARPGTGGLRLGSVRVRMSTSSVREIDLLGNRYRQAGGVRGGGGRGGRCSGSFKWGGGGVMRAKGGPGLMVRQGYVVSHRLL